MKLHDSPPASSRGSPLPLLLIYGQAVKPSDIGQLVSAADPKVSPDGRLIAFVVTRVDLAKNRYRSAVWLATTVTLSTAVFEGVLRVEDPTALRAALVGGIGPARVTA